jgi:hypothetical protein
MQTDLCSGKHVKLQDRTHVNYEHVLNKWLPIRNCCMKYITACLTIFLTTYIFTRNCKMIKSCFNPENVHVLYKMQNRCLVYCYISFSPFPKRVLFLNFYIGTWEVLVLYANHTPAGILQCWTIVITMSNYKVKTKSKQWSNPVWKPSGSYAQGCSCIIHHRILCWDDNVEMLSCTTLSGSFGILKNTWATLRVRTGGFQNRVRSLFWLCFDLLIRHCYDNSSAL